MLEQFKRRLHDVRTLARLCTSAEEIARQQGRHKPGSEHFILAALSLPDPTAAGAFASLGLTEKQFRDALVAQRADALASVGITHAAAQLVNGASVPASPTSSCLYETKPSGQALVKRLADTRRTRAGRVLLGADVLLAAAQERYTPACRAFQKLGVSNRRLVEAASQAVRAASQT